MKGYRTISRGGFWCLLWALALVAGCGEDQIQTYRVARLEPAPPASKDQPPTSASANSSEATEPSRIVAAIAQRPDAMWVFKIVGSPADMSSTEAAWRSFFEQITFGDDNVPHWTVPDGWKELPGNSFRHATLLIPGVDPPLELAISRLPAGQDLLMNVNRWRGQLALEPLRSDQLEAQWEKITAGSETLLVFDATGVSAAAAPAGPMSMGAPAAPAAAANSTVDPATDAELPFEFTPPEDWQPGPTTQFTLRRFLKTAGERSAQLAITRLQTAGQVWADNVGVWCGELGIAPLTADEVAAQTKEVSIDGRSAQSIALQSLPETGKASRIVSWSEGAESWFIKLTGDAALVAESDAEFEQLLASIRFAASHATDR
jgi:hypothetical protein